MFDVAFSEVVVIAVVALVVIGPEKLPKVARTLGLLAGRMQRYVANIKSDIEREMQLEDLKRLQEEMQSKMGKLESELNQAHAIVNNEAGKIELNIMSTDHLPAAGGQSGNVPAAVGSPVPDHSKPPAGDAGR